MVDVFVKETEEKLAEPGDRLLFPDVSSCICMICELQNSRRWAVHCVADDDKDPSQEGALQHLASLRSKALASNQKIQRVIGVGVIGGWSYHFENQKQLMNAHPNFKEMKYVPMVTALTNHLMIGPINMRRARQYLGNFFSCSESDVFLQHIEGNLQVKAGQTSASNYGIDQGRIVDQG